MYGSIQLVNKINRSSNKGTMNVFLEYLLKRTPTFLDLSWETKEMKTCGCHRLINGAALPVAVPFGVML
jgi:hypothetical protein